MKPVGNSISLAVAFGAGLVSFLSPCVLPLIPTYITYLAGTSIEDIKDDPASRSAFRARVLRNSLAFILGFSIIFIALGLSATVFGRFLLLRAPLVRQLSGLLIIVFGLHLAGILKIPFLHREKRAGVAGGGSGFGSSILIGMAFSAGWTPCIGPILSSILILAGQSSRMAEGGLLLAVYSLGLAIPFFLTAMFVGRLLPALRKLYPYLPYVSLVSGLLMVVMGVMLYFNSFARLSRLIPWSF